MASVTFAIFTVCLLSFTSSYPATDDNAPIEIIVPERCKGQLFCSEKPKNYEELQERMKKLIPQDLLKEIEGRQGIHDISDGLSEESDWHNCPYQKSVETPYFAQDQIDENSYYVVVQLGNKFEQTFTTIECQNKEIAKISNGSENQQCFPDLFPSFETDIGMQSQCIQRYSSRRLYIYDQKNNTLALKTYNKIPVFCTCRLSASLD